MSYKKNDNGVPVLVEGTTPDKAKGRGRPDELLLARAIANAKAEGMGFRHSFGVRVDPTTFKVVPNLNVYPTKACCILGASCLGDTLPAEAKNLNGFHEEEALKRAMDILGIPKTALKADACIAGNDNPDDMDPDEYAEIPKEYFRKGYPAGVAYRDAMENDE